jgi:hypothetical protein
MKNVKEALKGLYRMAREGEEKTRGKDKVNGQNQIDKGDDFGFFSSK